MGDVDTPRLLHTISGVPKDAQAISDAAGIPLSSVYRKLATLRSVGLAMVKSFEITPEGKRQDLFVSAVTEVRIRVDGDEVELELIPTKESADRIWFDLFKSTGQA